MAIYRYCFGRGPNSVEETQEHNFAHDRQAIDHGASIIAGHAGERFEIWRGSRLVQSYEPTQVPGSDSKQR